MYFVKVKDTSGLTCYVNPEHVEKIRDRGGVTRIGLKSGSNVDVDLEIEKVVDAFMVVGKQNV